MDNLVTVLLVYSNKGIMENCLYNRVTVSLVYINIVSPLLFVLSCCYFHFNMTVIEWNTVVFANGVLLCIGGSFGSVHSYSFFPFSVIINTKKRRTKKNVAHSIDMEMAFNPLFLCRSKLRRNSNILCKICIETKLEENR